MYSAVLGAGRAREVGAQDHRGRVRRGGFPPLARAVPQHGTYKTVTARFWTWLSGERPSNVSRCSLFARTWGAGRRARQEAMRAWQEAQDGRGRVRRGELPPRARGPLPSKKGTQRNNKNAEFYLRGQNLVLTVLYILSIRCKLGDMRLWVGDPSTSSCLVVSCQAIARYCSLVTALSLTLLS